MRVHDAMTTPVKTAGPDDSLTEIAGRMALAKIGALPVVERGVLIGLVTVTDVLDAEVRSAMAPAPLTLATAADAMTPFPLATTPQTPIAEAVALMVDHHVRHLPVVDSTSTVVGMLPERDVRSAIGDPVQYVELRRSTTRLHVRDVMTTPVISVQFDTPLIAVARLFADVRIGALPVFDKFGALVGIVSYVDALRVLS
jgi:acetoin utilization protein AcuB